MSGIKTGKENLSASTAFINMFSSTTTAIFLITLLTIACTLGTFIPQCQDYPVYKKNFPSYINLIYFFSLNDLYHCGWFYFLISLLSLNISVCSIRRLFSRFKQLKIKKYMKNGEDVKKLKYNFEAPVSNEGPGICEFIKRLKKAGYKIQSEENNHKTFFFAEAGRYFFSGEQLVHLSFLIIIAGAMLGNIYGYKTNVHGCSGDIISVPSKKYHDVKNRIDSLVEYSKINGGGVHSELASLVKEFDSIKDKEMFKFRIDDFKTLYFEADKKNGETHVKNWNTDVSVLGFDSGETILRYAISVNNPLAYNGVTIYQTSYYKSYDKIKSLELDVSYNGENSRILFSDETREAEISGGKVKFRLAGFLPDFRLDAKTREIYSASGNPNNPAAKFLICVNGVECTRPVWLFKNMPELGEKMMPATAAGIKAIFSKLELDFRDYSELQINYDPGINLIWTGFILISAGLYMSLNVTHKRIWIICDKFENKIAAGGISNKNEISFSNEFDAIFKQTGGGGV